MTRPGDSDRGLADVSSEVFVLGAGFSHAVSPIMPLMSDLGRDVAERLDRKADFERFGQDLETWMDFLAARHPWMSESQSLRNQAEFLEVAQGIRNVLMERQNRAVADERPPEWLARIVRFWLQSHATVITLNYDLLVEKATGFVVHRVNGGTGGTYPSLYPSGVASITAQSVPGGLNLGHERIRDPFTLFKLHGSLSWYRGDDTAGGGPAFEVHLDSNWRSDDPEQVAASAPGKVPLIAPPTTGKSSWFGHEYLRIQWTHAVTSLRSASGVTFIGYSLPPTDSTLRLALIDSVSAHRIRVVDVSGAVVERYNALFGDARVEPIIAGDAILRFLDQTASASSSMKGSHA